MANTKLENKVRNPKNLNKWLDIWSADITNDTNYTLIPSSHWLFPIGLDNNYDAEEECLIIGDFPLDGNYNNFIDFIEQSIAEGVQNAKDYADNLLAWRYLS